MKRGILLALLLGAVGTMMMSATAGADLLGSRPPGRTVYAWFPKDFNNWNTAAIDWTALTHICYRSVILQADGTLSEPVARADVRKLVLEAHSNGVKVAVLVWGTTPEGSSQYLAHHRDRAVESLLDYVKANDLDGINLDDETWREINTETQGSNRELITQFFKRLRKAFDDVRPGCHITWASPPVVATQDRWGECWVDYRAVADLVDAFAIMSYCMNPPTIGWTTGAQPVRGGGKVSGHARDYATCIEDYLRATGGRNDKLLLGIANDRGGTEWTCRTDQAFSPIIGEPRRLTPQEARANAGEHGRLFHPEQQVPWYRYEQGDHWVQGWYEDDESLAAKLELAESDDLQGICIWVLDGAAEPPSTFELIRRHLHDSGNVRSDATGG